MGRSVRISEDDLRPVFEVADEVMARHPPDYVAHQRAALENIRRALARLDRIPKTHRRKRLALETHVPGSGWVKARVSRKPSKEEKRDETAAIRRACLQRADGLCECGCGHPLQEPSESDHWEAETPELDHFFGRGKVKQSVETCWILRADCHQEKTNNRPDAATWLRKFIAHCDKRYAESVAAGTAADTHYTNAVIRAERRLRFVETRSALPAAPRIR
jgi:5-methylcytosine-specific restriction endonuclease McrA